MQNICWQATLGEDESLKDRIRNHVNMNTDKKDPLVLISACQAYSVIGRSRNSGNKKYIPEEDKRQLLYVEYLEILVKAFASHFCYGKCSRDGFCHTEESGIIQKELSVTLKTPVRHLKEREEHN